MTGSDGADLVRRERFDALFALVYEPLQRYVQRRGGGSDTDDIVAEALTVLWRRLDDVPADAQVAWALGVARRCLANHRRSAARREALEQRVTAVSGHEPAPDGELDAAMSLLNADQRELLRLWAWEGLAPREIAVVVGSSANAVSIRLYRARRELAGLLAPRKVATVHGHRGIRTTEEER
jgi:RNA polymerase sigma-70 factor (ECF subfamily)